MSMCICMHVVCMVHKKSIGMCMCVCMSVCMYVCMYV